MLQFPQLDLLDICLMPASKESIASAVVYILIDSYIYSCHQRRFRLANNHNIKTPRQIFQKRLKSLQARQELSGIIRRCRDALHDAQPEAAFAEADAVSDYIWPFPATLSLIDRLNVSCRMHKALIMICTEEI